MTPAPLEGIRVLELTEGTAGQSAGMLLADLGADVVRPTARNDTDGAGRPGWLCWNRGKTLARFSGDAAADAAQISRLAQRADVLVADAHPGRLEAQGLDQASLSGSALVHVWMPPVTTDGRWSQLPHDNLLLDALSGFAGHHPAIEDVPVASAVPGRLYLHGALGAGAAVGGLVAREQDGWGRSATVTGLQAAAVALTTLMMKTVDGAEIVSTGKSVDAGASFRLYQGSDERWFFLGALSPELFIKALEVLDRMDVLVRDDVAGDFANIFQPEVSAAIAVELGDVIRTKPTAHWLEAFGAADVPAAPMSDPGEWLQSEILAEACPPAERQHPELGPVTVPGSPIAFSTADCEPGALPVEAQSHDLAEAWAGVEPVQKPEGEAPGAGLPLEGLKVIDMATFLAGPFVSSLLAAHGADVVKVEPPAGDPYGLYGASYAVVNEHKQRAYLDIADPDGRQSFLDLVGKADVVVDNLLPSSLERLDLRPDAFEEANANLIRCSLTAYGQSGPWASFPGFDPIMQTLSGLVAVQGGAGRPIATTAPMTDVAAGSLGALGTMAALFARARTGESQRVFTSLAAATTYLQSGELTTYDGRQPRAVGGPDFPGPSAYRRYYRGADRWLAVSATTPDQQEALLSVMARPDLASAADATLATALAELFEAAPVEESLTALTAAGVPACPVVEPNELDDAFLVEHDYSHVLHVPDLDPLVVIGGFTDWRGSERRQPNWPEGFESDQATVLRRW